MKKEVTKEQVKIINKHGSGGGGGMVYCLGFVGAFIYYIQHSQTFMDGVVGFLKALVWPAFLIHRIFELLKM